VSAQGMANAVPAPRWSGSAPSQSSLSRPFGDHRLSRLTDSLVDDQLARWAHLIEFVETSREAGVSNKAPASNHGL
jgi:hypothetical protein